LVVEVYRFTPSIDEIRALEPKPPVVEEKKVIPAPELSGELILTKTEADPKPVRPIWDGNEDHRPSWVRADIAWKLEMQEWIGRQ
jgi:hypothetical protein